MTRILWRPLCTRGHRLVVDLLWEPRDLWWGIYWHSFIGTACRRCLSVYVCFVPAIPLRLAMVLWHVRYTWPGYDEGADDDV